MGPQHIAAENNRCACTAGANCGCFNGAAAHRCGKHHVPFEHREHRCASMGPQHIAAENARGRGGTDYQLLWASMGPQHIAAENIIRWCTKMKRRCFNGAAAHRCGKPQSSTDETCHCPSLQWGRSTSLRKTSVLPEQCAFQPRASMGPQHIAAENAIAPRTCAMRPPLQWGRSTSLRKTQHADQYSYVYI